jgi:CBS domain-containing protein
MMKTDVAIKDLMTTTPVIINLKSTAVDAAREMKGEGVGSLIVMENGYPIGIVTESDILKKVVATGKDPSQILVEQVMNSPIITVRQNTTIEEAIKTMGKYGIRRLPVVEKGKLVGMATDKDILKVSPMLLEVAREWALVTENEGRAYKRGKIFSGKCEDCGMLSTRLTNTDGRLLCESCAESSR